MHHPRLLAALLPASVLATSAPSPVAADTILILHSISHHDPAHCSTPQDQGYSDARTQTTTSAQPGTDIDVYIYLFAYESARGVGFRIAWPADWTYRGWSSDCLDHQVTMTDPQENHIDIGTAFDLMTGGALAPLGFASFTTGATGEVTLEPPLRGCASGTVCYIDGDIVEQLIPSERTGRVAVGGPGYNPAAPTPVAPSSWGGIKARYQSERSSGI
jgi:hypothetical protein